MHILYDSVRLALDNSGELLWDRDIAMWKHSRLMNTKYVYVCDFFPFAGCLADKIEFNNNIILLHIIWWLFKYLFTDTNQAKLQV